MENTELFTQKIKDELQPLGYKIYPLGLTLVRGVTPDGWVYDNADGRLVLEAMYNHCQAKKRLDAMEALLKDMLGNELYLDTDDRCHPSTQLLGWIRRVEELLK